MSDMMIPEMPALRGGNAVLLRQIFRILRRQGWVLCVVGGAVFLLGLLILSKLTPSYTATATVAIAPQAADPLTAVQPAEEVDDSVPATQAAEISSRDVAAAVLSQIPPLPAKPAFGLASLPCRLLRYNCAQPPINAAAKQQAAIDTFLNSLLVLPELHSLVIDISVTAPTGPRAAMLADAVATNYQRISLSGQTQSLNQVAAWLDNRTHQLQQRWLDSVQAADAYSVTHGLTQAELAGAPDPLVDTQIMNMAAGLSAGQANLAIAQSRAEALNDAARQGQAGGLLSLPEQPILVAAANQLMVLQSQRDQLATEFGTNYPKVQALNDEITQTRRTLNDQTGAALSSIHESEVAARADVDELASNLNALKVEAAGQSASQAQYRSLNDEADSARSVYETFLEHANEVVDRAALLQPPVVFVSHAGIPLSPTFPNKTKLGLAVLVLAIAAGAAAAFAREYMSEGFVEAELLRANAQEPILASLQWITGRPGSIARHVLDRPFSRTGEAVRGLVSKLSLLSVDAHASRSILVTSASPLEGKSTLALWMVMTMRQGGHNVLLIDGDHRRGSVLAEKTADPRPGLSDYITGDVQATDLVQTDSTTGIDFIASGRAMSRPFGPHEIARLRELLAAMKRNYKIVVIDSPPLLAIADGFVHASIADQIVFVCRWQQSSRQAVMASLGRLREYGAKVSGLVVTMVGPGAVSDFDGEYSRREQNMIARFYGS